MKIETKRLMAPKRWTMTMSVEANLRNSNYELGSSDDGWLDEANLDYDNWVK